jgi:hypothetical protein
MKELSEKEIREKINCYFKEKIKEYFEKENPVSKAVLKEFTETDAVIALEETMEFSDVNVPKFKIEKVKEKLPEKCSELDFFNMVNLFSASEKDCESTVKPQIDLAKMMVVLFEKMANGKDYDVDEDFNKTIGNSKYIITQLEKNYSDVLIQVRRFDNVIKNFYYSNLKKQNIENMIEKEIESAFRSEFKNYDDFIGSITNFCNSSIELQLNTKRLNRASEKKEPSFVSSCEIEYASAEDEEDFLNSFSFNFLLKNKDKFLGVLKNFFEYYATGLYKNKTQ